MNFQSLDCWPSFLEAILVQLLQWEISPSSSLAFSHPPFYHHFFLLNFIVTFLKYLTSFSYPIPLSGSKVSSRVASETFEIVICCNFVWSNGFGGFLRRH